MKIFSSKTKKGFYFQGIGSIPEDAVELSKQDHVALLEGQAQGLVISFEYSPPKLVAGPVADPVAPEREWRDNELLRSDFELFKVQDSDQKASGTVGSWRDYRKILRAWPEHKEFPKKAFRPRAPDFKE